MAALARAFGVAWAALLVTLPVACGPATEIPPGGQAVQVSATADGLLLEPSVVHPGDVYLVLAETASGVSFVHRSADPDNPHSPPLPVTDDDIRSVESEGSFQGANHEGLYVGGYGNVSRVGPLVAGKYLLLVDENDEPPWSAALLKLAVLEVRN